MQSDSKKPENENVGWYALKVFYNRIEQVREEIQGLAKEIYAPRNVISSLMFVRITPAKLEYMRKDHYKHLKVYSQPGERTPYVIPDREMEVFKFVTSMEDKNLTLIDPATVNYKEGEHVRVTGGILCSNQRAATMMPSVPSFCTPGSPARNLSVTSLPSPTRRNLSPGISSISSRSGLSPLSFM